MHMSVISLRGSEFLFRILRSLLLKEIFLGICGAERSQLRLGYNTLCALGRPMRVPALDHPRKKKTSAAFDLAKLVRISPLERTCAPY